MILGWTVHTLDRITLGTGAANRRWSHLWLPKRDCKGAPEAVQEFPAAARRGHAGPAAPPGSDGARAPNWRPAAGELCLPCLNGEQRDGKQEGKKNESI